jgi:predicted deacetylase
MGAKYLLRFDDICPTMNWQVWVHLESILTELHLKPILAVVPDNRDPQLQVAPPRANFWEEVRRWQKMGWTIGLHGYQHLYVTDHPGLIGLNALSEFAGLPAPEQEMKIRNAFAIFERENVKPEIWVAPAHSFDDATVKILRRLNLQMISDGFFPFPHRDRDGMFWIPQQMWRFRKMLFGVWTICLHHNNWNAAAVARFRQDAEKFREKMATVAEVASEFAHHRLRRIERWGAKLMLAALLAKRDWSKQAGDLEA